MQLIAPLAAGVRGAENGSVRIQRRGSAALASYYTDFEATGGSVSGTDVLDLDENGRLIVYVNELVDCIIYDEDGATLTEFVAGSSASSIEVISQSATGVDYASGASGASKPTTLQSFIDGIKTSFGATDGNVLFGGASVTLQAALASLGAASFYNVKSSAYGAVGDGATNDTTAIQNALTAAGNAGGGIVLFPKGTYKTTAALTIPAGVSLLGVGPYVSIIKLTHATADICQGTGNRAFAIGMGFDHSQVNSGEGFYAGLGNGWTFIDCAFGASGFSTNHLVAGGSSGDLCFFNCEFWLCAGASGDGIFHAGTGPLRLIASKFGLASAGSYGGNLVRASGATSFFQVVGNTFDLSSMSSGSPVCVLIGASTSLALVGNMFRNPTGGTPAVFSAPAVDCKGIMEAGNAIGSSYTLPTATVTAAASSFEGYGSMSRDKRRYYLASDANQTVPAASYGTAEIVRSNNAAQTINFDTPPGPGHKFTLVLNNLAVGSVSGTITMGTGGIKGVASFTVNANRWSAYHFRSIAVGANLYWSLVKEDANET